MKGLKNQSTYGKGENQVLVKSKDIFTTIKIPLVFFGKANLFVERLTDSKVAYAPTHKWHINY